MGYPERLAEAASESEVRSILSELLDQGSRRWKRRHVERHLAKDFHFVLDEYFSSNGEIRTNSLSLKVVRWLEGTLRKIGGLGFIPLLKYVADFSGNHKTFQNAIDYALDHEGTTTVVVAEEKIVIATAMVDLKAAKAALRAAAERVSFDAHQFDVEADFLNSIDEIAPWLRGADTNVQKTAVQHLLCTTDFLASVCFRVIYGEQTTISAQEIWRHLSRRSRFEWPKGLVEYVLMQDWRFWPIGPQEFQLTSEVEKSGRTEGEIARRFLSALDEAVAGCGDETANPLTVDTGAPIYAKLRVYFVEVSQGGGKTGRYSAKIYAGERGPEGKILVDRSNGRIPVLCGYCYEQDVFVLWDMGLYDEYSYGHPVAVGMDTVYQAVAGGLGREQRSIRAGKEIVVTAPPERLAEGLAQRVELSIQRLTKVSFEV